MLMHTDYNQMASTSYLNNGWQNPLCIVCSKCPVDFRQLSWDGSRQHTQADVDLQIIARIWTKAAAMPCWTPVATPGRLDPNCGRGSSPFANHASRTCSE